MGERPSQVYVVEIKESLFPRRDPLDPVGLQELVKVSPGAFAHGGEATAHAHAPKPVDDGCLHANRGRVVIADEQRKWRLGRQQFSGADEQPIKANILAGGPEGFAHVIGGDNYHIHPHLMARSTSPFDAYRACTDSD